MFSYFSIHNNIFQHEYTPIIHILINQKYKEMFSFLGTT